jgi:hypothetical protein
MTDPTPNAPMPEPPTVMEIDDKVKQVRAALERWGTPQPEPLEDTEGPTQ